MAACMGVSAFPTVGVEWLAGLPSSSVDAIVDTVARSLIARNLLGRADDGSAAYAGDLRSIIEAPLFAELVIEVVHMKGVTTQQTWIGVAVDQATRVVVTDDGTRRIDQFAPACVAAAVLAATDDSGRPARRDLEPPHGRITEAMVGDPSSDLTSLTRITTTWRLDGRLHGGVFFWAQDATGAGWMAEPDGSEWTLHRSSGLHQLLLAHLPTRIVSTVLK